MTEGARPAGETETKPHVNSFVIWQIRNIVIYKFLSFYALLSKDHASTIHQQNLQRLALSNED